VRSASASATPTDRLAGEQVAHKLRCHRVDEHERRHERQHNGRADDERSFA